MTRLAEPAREVHARGKPDIDECGATARNETLGGSSVSTSNSFTSRPLRLGASNSRRTAAKSPATPEPEVAARHPHRDDGGRRFACGGDRAQTPRRANGRLRIELRSGGSGAAHVITRSLRRFRDQKARGDRGAPWKRQRRGDVSVLDGLRPYIEDKGPQTCRAPQPANTAPNVRDQLYRLLWSTPGGRDQRAGNSQLLHTAC